MLYCVQDYILHLCRTILAAPIPTKGMVWLAALASIEFFSVEGVAPPAPNLETHAAEGSARWLVFLELLVFVLPSNNSGSVWLVLPSAEQTRVSKLGGSFDGTPNSSELGNRPVWHAFWLQGAAAERALSGGRRHCILVMIVIYTILCIYIMYIAALFWCTILEYMVDNLGAVTRSVHPNNEQSDFLKFLYL